MKIRPATTDDLNQILEIYNYSIVHTTAVYSYEPKNQTWIIDWFNIKQKEGFPVLVALEANQIVGFASYGHFRQWPAYLYTVEHSVHVHHQHQGKGVARGLMLELIRIAKSNGIRTMIGGVDADNKGSLIFHEKLGFESKSKLEQVGYKFDRWLDLVFVQKLL